MQDMHNEIQDALGQNYALPEDVDEEDLMGELDALEDELSSEPASSASVPSYLQVGTLHLWYKPVVRVRLHWDTW